MKLTLFTISNEQIKEQLSKLQMKVESLETVKDVQDKIISAKDSQISFLNDQIANIWTPITIVAGLIALVVTYVAWVNKKADEKIQHGSKQIALAKEKIDQAELLIQKSNTTAAIAQEKLNQLEDKQNELNDLAITTITNQKIDMLIRQISITLDLSKNITDKIIVNGDLVASFQITEEQEEKLYKLGSRHASILESYRILALHFNFDVAKGQKINLEEITNGADRLRIKSNDLYHDCLRLRDELGLED
ncbi:hypothetical protein [Bacillus cereus]|uniref:hypothetical protein n=1 Tax=Bacillus cereus TaxID=1396 RepID=UPI000279024D|nr:hypothetical protein [Bacillus cereus]EJQ01401.1 hypothetical protein IE1_05776 [Bacillus cereus BAG3O-2]